MGRLPHAVLSTAEEKAMTRSRVIMDIETIGCDWAALSDEERAYLTERALGDDPAAKEQVARDRLALSALTGEIVLVGLLNPRTGKGKIHYVRCGCPTPGVGQSETPGVGQLPDVLTTGAADGDAFRAEVQLVGWPDETSLLSAFWQDLTHYDQLISFNGRSFDGPYLMHRSLILGVPVGRDLVPNRYHDSHLDLMDRLSCYGATRDRYSLDFWCRRLGIPSPKDGGVNGADVERLWREGKLAELCRYNAGDLTATAALFQKYAAAFGNLLPR